MGTPPGWAGQGRRRLLGWEGADRPGPAPRNRGGTWVGTVAPLSSGGKHDRVSGGGGTPTGAATSRQNVAATTVGAGPHPGDSGLRHLGRRGRRTLLDHLIDQPEIPGLLGRHIGIALQLALDRL